MQPPKSARDHILWIGALLAFTLAAATGALFRFGVVYGFSLGLAFENVRHGHSHLMYFGWVSPALFLLLYRRVEYVTGRKATKTQQLSTIAALVLGFASFIPFLLFGYDSVTIGSVHLPPSVIIAGLNMLAWYGFVIGYLGQTKGVSRRRTLVLFDGALMFLVLASLGAWGISMVGPLGAEETNIASAFTHLFLGYFTEGWLTLAILGLASSFVKPGAAEARAFMLFAWTLFVGIAASFLLGMPQADLSPTAQSVARIGSGLIAAGLFYFVYLIAKDAGRSWRLPGFFLTLKAIGFLIVCATPTIWWAHYAAERVLYFHVHLLGFTTLGILAAAQLTAGSQAKRQIQWMNVTVMCVVLSLLPMTLFWPASLRGAWIPHIMAWAALGPFLVGLWMTVQQRSMSRMPSE